MQSVDTFKKSLDHDQPPEGSSELLQALWWEAKGDWEQAHRIAQDVSTSDAAWVHAYLHRKEGDDGNAGYWYSHAGKPKVSKPHDQEWEEIVRSFLKNG